MVRLVLFDIDGTLIRTGGAGIKAFARVFAAEFAAHDHFERLKFAGRTDYGIVREFFGFHQIPPTSGRFERFFDHYTFLLDHLLDTVETRICEGVPAFLAQLRALPQPPLLGLLTGNIRLGAEIKLRRANLWDWFETGAFADDHEDRDQIAAVARARGSRVLGRTLAPEEVLVVGDTPLDIRCARAIQARVLAVATGGSTLEELRAHQPDWAVSSLEMISGAEVIGDLPPSRRKSKPRAAKRRLGAAQATLSPA